VVVIISHNIFITIIFIKILKRRLLVKKNTILTIIVTIYCYWQTNGNNIKF